MRGIRAAVALVALAAALTLSLAVAGVAQAATGRALIYTGNSAADWFTFTRFASATGKTLDTLTTLPSDLSQYDCVVLPVNDTLFSSSQKTALATYVNTGGRLLALTEYSGWDFGDAIASMNDLGSALGSSLTVVPAVLGLGYTTTVNVDANLFTSGVSSIRYAASSAVAAGAGSSSLIRSVEGTTIVGAQQLGSGYFVLAGDSNIFSDFSDNGYTAHGNGTLASNICNASQGGGTIDDLYGEVLALGLDPEQAQTLIDLLLRTNEYLAAGEYEDAIDKLYDFIDKVEDYVENGTLSPAYGEGLISLTEAIIASLEETL